MNCKKIMKQIMLLLFVIALLPFSVVAEEANTVIEPPYSTVLKDWQEKGIEDNISHRDVVNPDQFNTEEPILTELDSGKPYIRFVKGNEVELIINVPNDALYNIEFEYYPTVETIVPLEVSLMINDKLQFFESKKIPLETHWEITDKEPDLDRYGNEVLPKQKIIKKWYNTKAQDSRGIESEPLRFYLKSGSNKITIKNLQIEFLLGNINIVEIEKNVSYIDYQQENTSENANDVIVIEAEEPTRKNSPSIQMEAIKDISLTPYNAKTLQLNVLGESWKKGGQSVTWTFTAKKDGYYNITFKAKQKDKNQLPVYRNILIDGEVPFEEIVRYPFKYSKKWINDTLKDEEGNAYQFFLTKGSHEITAIVDVSPFKETIEGLNAVTNDINNLALEIKKLTGNNQDPNRDWNIIEYMPDIQSRINGWKEVLENQYIYINSLSVSDREPATALTIKVAIKRLSQLAKNPNDLPNQLPALSEGSGSVAQSLGDLSQSILNQSLLVDKVFVHGVGTKLPKPEASLWSKIIDAIYRFFLSFSKKSYDIKEQSEDELVIWVNRPRQYVAILQQMVDTQFTEQTGIKVTFSIMPNEQKVILANAAKTNPDAVLGLSTWLPYELAMRGAATDLRQFDDFDKFIKVFSPGSIIPYVIDESVYAIPETQDFWVLFYRQDLLGKLNIPIPNKWDEVISILPDLQRYGMNFYTPLAGAGGFKPFMSTAPYIYQFGGDIFSPNATNSVIDSEKSLQAIKFMADSYTMYSMPVQVPSFYNHFRYGTLPIGISNFSTYLQLLNAAPEISGSWSIAPYPGIENEEGVVERWAPGSAQSCMIFNNSEKEKEAWEFLKWYMSTEVQTEYAMTLITTLGQEYLWNTANIDAFKQLPYIEEHKAVILEQWDWLKEVPKIPGSYMAEREISNAWNRIVFDGVGVREAVDDATITINREIMKKMEEFKYIENGKFVKEYKLPTIEQVESWVNDSEKE